jgi:hypothetical protein
VSGLSGTGSPEGSSLAATLLIVAWAGVTILARRLLLLIAFLITAVIVTTSGPVDGLSWPGLSIALLFVALLWVPWSRLRSHPPAILRRYWRATFVGCCLAVLGVIAIAPALTFYRVVHDEQFVLFEKQQQLDFARALGARADSLADRYDDTILWSSASAEEAEAPTGDSVAEAMLAALFSDGTAHDLSDAPDVYCLPKMRGSHQPHDHGDDGPATLAMEAEERNDCRPRDPSGQSDPACALRGQEAESVQWIAGLMEQALPRYGPLTTGSRALADPTGSRLEWWMTEDQHERTVNLCFPDYRAAMSLGSRRSADEGGAILRAQPGGSSRPSLHVSSEVHGFSLGSPIAWLLAGLALVVPLAVLLRSILHRVFLAGFRRPTVLHDDGRRRVLGFRHRLLLRPDEETIAGWIGEPGTLVIGVAELRSREPAELVKEAEARVVVLTEFDEGLGEPALANRKLELIEGLAADPERRLVILSEIDPMYFFTRQATDSWVGTKPSHLDRWGAALEEFEKLRGDADDLDHDRRRREYEDEVCAHLPGDVARALAHECWASPPLRRIGRWLAAHRDVRRMTPEQVVDLVLDRAEPHYRRIWSTCSTDEKVLLHRLAQEGFVNWQMRETLSRLVRRGLVLMGPGFPLMSESFRQFAQRVERSGVFRAWERDAGLGIWQRVRTPLLVLLFALASFFFATQREAFDQSLVPLVAALPAAGPILVKLMGMTAQARKT